MIHSDSIFTESRHDPRLCLPKGLLCVTLPPPLVWNWFTDTQEVAVLNLSCSGLGIESMKLIEGELTFKLKFKNGGSHLLSGCICHQQITHAGYYYGVICSREHSFLEHLLVEMRLKQGLSPVPPHSPLMSYENEQQAQTHG